MQCPNCQASSIKKAGGSYNTVSGKKNRYECKSCGYAWKELEPTEDIFDESIVKTTNKKTTSKKYVITSCQSNTETNEDFLKTILNYCRDNSAELMVIPVPYKAHSIGDQSDEHRYDEALHDYLLEDNTYLHDNLKVLGQLKIVATAVNPLSGLDSICRGDSVIIGHNQVQLKTLPILQGDLPVIMTTTGTVSHPNYQISKQGYKATYNHCYAATLVEIDNDNYFHIRQLQFDGIGMYDLDKYYRADGDIEHQQRCEALITGDEHVMFADYSVTQATYGKDSIASLIRPKFIIRHDVLDSYSISHHHERNQFIKYAKFESGVNKIQDELDLTVEYIEQTTPEYSQSVIVSSNHHDHLTRWLTECEPKHEPWNALFYHTMMVKMLEGTTLEKNGASYPNPFSLYYETSYPDTKTVFIGRNESFVVAGIELSQHGDKGVNGSRGSRAQFASIPTPTVIGHSHSPGITQGCYQVGTSSLLNVEYNSGPSSWLNTHCIVYPNSKRTLINIIRGRWRA